MSKQVLSTIVGKTEGYCLRKTFFGKYVLQIKEQVTIWDTNTGKQERTYSRVRDVNSNILRNINEDIKIETFM